MQYKVKDFYFKRAKEQGYRSRAAYKLKEILDKYKLLKGVRRIVDLGCAPGGFLQALAEKAGEKALIVGVDLKPTAPLSDERIIILQGDATEKKVQEEIKARLGGSANLIVSDMAPSTSGVRELDAENSLELCKSALEIAVEILAENGTLVMKIFESEEANLFRKEMKQFFSEIKATRPQATRKGSRELYIIAQGFRKSDG
ncbi:MAG: 23S rRNA (uridine(2552)-2'-O)-methyltransferase [Myxococcota bacterium]